MNLNIEDVDIFPTDLPYTIRRNILSGNENIKLNTGNLVSSQHWSRPYFEYTIEYDILVADEMQELEDFWVAHRFNREGIDYFLFKDYLYHKEVGTEFGIGDASTHFYRLKLDYSSLNRPYSHPVGWIKPDTETLYLDGEEIIEDDYSIDYDTGVVNLNFVPEIDEVLTANFEFYRKCKFMDAQFTEHARMEEHQSAQIEIREVS